MKREMFVKYEAPEMEIVEVKVEMGFDASNAGAELGGSEEE